MTPNYSDLELMQARISFVPKDWIFSTIGQSYVIKNNLRKPINETERSSNPGPYPYYGPTKIQDYIGSFEQDGDYVLIGEDGDHFLKYETHSMTQLVEGKCTINNHAHIIEGTALASREWFYYYFMHRDIFSFLSRQGAGRYKLNKASLEKLPILLPPIQEQQKIAEILSTWDKAITITENLIANSEMQKKSLMQQLLTGKKRLLDENGVRFCGEWESNELQKISTITKGKQLNKSTLTKTGEYPVINGGIEPSGYSPNYNTDANTITISEGGNSCGFIGYQTTNFWCGGHCYYLSALKINKPFLFQALKFNESKIMTLRVGSGLPNIQKKAIESYSIDYPHQVNEQEKIAKVLSNADREIELLQAKLEHLKQEKKALMQQLLTGKRRVVIN